MEDNGHNQGPHHGPDTDIIKRQPAEMEVPILVSPHPHTETHNDGRNSEAHGHVKLHVSVVYVTKFREHPLKVKSVHEQPREDTQPKVVEEDGDHLAGKLGLDDEVVVLSSDDEKELGDEEGHDDEPVDGVGVGRQAVQHGERQGRGRENDQGGYGAVEDDGVRVHGRKNLQTRGCTLRQHRIGGHPVTRAVDVQFRGLAELPKVWKVGLATLLGPTWRLRIRTVPSSTEWF